MHENLPKARSQRERGVSGARQRGVEAHDVRFDHRFQEERCHENTNGPLEVVVVDVVASSSVDVLAVQL